jgi:hypothetical protein
MEARAFGSTDFDSTDLIERDSISGTCNQRDLQRDLIKLGWFGETQERSR